MKIYGMIRHNPQTNRLDLGDNPDPGIFKVILPLPHRGFGKSPKILRLADLRLNKLKAALAEVSAACVFLFWFVVSNLLAP